MPRILKLLRVVFGSLFPPRARPCATIIIPARNAENAVAHVVKQAKASRFAAEVLVVDGFSTDQTAQRAKAAGATVIRQSRRRYPGKGIALADGLRHARFSYVAFVDADMEDFSTDNVDLLLEPLVENRAEFVKANYSKKKGRVTELVAKPLLSLFFPEAARFGYPLSGEFAVRRRVLKRFRLEPDWGVDVGLLLDIVLSGARVSEVNLVEKSHPQKELENLGPMAQQVARAILFRAKKHGRLKRLDLEQIEDVEEALEQAVESVESTEESRHGWQGT